MTKLKVNVESKENPRQLINFFAGRLFELSCLADDPHTRTE